MATPHPLAFLCFLAASVPALAEPDFAVVADLTVAAPVVVQARIARAERLPDRDSPGLAPGHARLLVTAALDSAIVAPAPVPAELTWLWDAPLDAKGKLAKRKNLPVMAWIATPSPDGKTRLIAANAQQPWTPTLDSTVRGIATENRSGVVPKFTAVTSGFRADGTVTGESESQFFLATADGPGATLIVTTRPGAARRVTVAKGDVIDESATTVKSGSLLWYRLACTLPAKLPLEAGGDDKALADDWNAAIVGLGPCSRRPAPG